MLEGRYRPQYNGRTQYDLKFFCDRLPISPLVRHFNAEDRHQWGLLSANISARASASKGPEFQRSLKINGIDRETPAFMKLTEANWGSKEYGFFVKLIAGSLRVPELLDSNFDNQNSAFVLGVVALLHPSWRCQKQPWTKTTALYLGSTISGLPGRSRRCSRNRYPIP